MPLDYQRLAPQRNDFIAALHHNYEIFQERYNEEV